MADGYRPEPELWRKRGRGPGNSGISVERSPFLRASRKKIMVKENTLYTWSAEAKCSFKYVLKLSSYSHTHSHRYLINHYTIKSGETPYVLGNRVHRDK
jgi:hypothetical protein